MTLSPALPRGLTSHRTGGGAWDISCWIQICAALQLEAALTATSQRSGEVPGLQSQFTAGEQCICDAVSLTKLEMAT